MRGEQSAMPSSVVCKAGSPPLARGTGNFVNISGTAQGITPACAGNSRHWLFVDHCEWDHPRLRGEQRQSRRRTSFCGGSPPLARGTEMEAKKRPTEGGITPACAGNRQLGWLLRGLHWDHPRLRGEQQTLYILYGWQRGITPACAGNSGKCRRAVRQRGDHPRLRGEQRQSRRRTSFCGGSPPLARGTGTRKQKYPDFARITPACAGNRLYHRYIPTSRGDHPRLRGEQTPTRLHCVSCVGSPPLARGTEMYTRGAFVPTGITPACAGNSDSVPASPVDA